MARVGNIALSALVCLCLTTTMAPSVQASASAQAPAARASAVNGDVSITEGENAKIQGAVPVAYANSLVYLEAIEKNRRYELGMEVSDSQGNVTFDVQIGGEGTYKARLKVVKNGKIRWTGPTFDVVVAPTKRKHHAVEDAYDLFLHAAPDRTAATDIVKRNPRLTTRSDAKLTSRSEELDAPGSGLLGVASTVDASTDLFEGEGAEALKVVGPFDMVAKIALKAIFGQGNQDQVIEQQITQLTQIVQQDFAQVQAQLTAIQSQVTALQQQVSAVQAEVANANASAATSSCVAAMSQADSYVQQIKTATGNYAVVGDPGWLQANVIGQAPSQGLRAVGNQIFGQGSGTPSFASGVISLQTATSSLASLLAGGLLDACATAVSGGVTASFANKQAASGNTGNAAIVPIGAVEEAYFTRMQAIVAHYSNYVGLGQSLAARGGQMAAAVLAGTAIENRASFDDICVGVAPQAIGSALSCGRILYNLNTSLSQIQAAWAKAGASWSQVSHGYLAGDAEATNQSTFMVPARNAWVKDIANYGASVPGLQPPGLTGGFTAANVSAAILGCSGTASCPTGVTATVDGNLVTLTVNWDGPVPPLISGVSPVSPNNRRVQLVSNGNTLSYWPDGPITSSTTFSFSATEAFNANGAGTTQIDATLNNTESNARTASTTSSSTNITLTGIFSPTTVYYSPTGALGSSDNGTNLNAPAGGTTQLSIREWLGLPFTGANSASWQGLLPTHNGPQTTATTGSLMGQAGLVNGGTTPSNLILYTGETMPFSIINYSNLGQAQPNCARQSSSGNVKTWADTVLTAASFVDTNVVPSNGNLKSSNNPNNLSNTNIRNGTGQAPTYTATGPANVVVNAPSSSSGTLNTGANIQWAFAIQNDLGEYNCSASGPQTISPTWFQSPATLTGNYTEACLNQVCPVLPWNSTPNTSFYAPLNVNLNANLNVPGSSNRDTVTWSNQSMAPTATPGYMTYPGMNSTIDQMYLWPTVQLNGQTSPCAMTSFTQGVGGSAGVGNVCQSMFQEWLAADAGLPTGPIQLRAGYSQPVLTAAGNYVASVAVTNSSSSAQTFTFYADVLNGGANVGNLVNAGDSAGAGSAGASVANCSTFNSALQCTVTVQPGASALSIPITGTFSTASLFVGAAGNGIDVATTTSMLPTAPLTASSLPSAPTNLVAVAGVDIDITWTAPSAMPPVSGYSITLTDSSGKATSLSTTGTNPVVTTTSGQTVSASVPAPVGTAGLWTVAVAAVNAAGTGDVATASFALGNSVPITPTNFTVVEGDDGSLQLSWNPVTASPLLSNYSITYTPPTGAAKTVTTTNTTYSFQNVNAVGLWSFSLTAVNPLGSSAANVQSLTISGIAPSEPQNLDVDVNDRGWVSASFATSVSVPVADTYTIALYAPGATVAVASLAVPATEKMQMIRARNFFRLSGSSAPGLWKVVVTPTNTTTGIGDYAESGLNVNTDLLADITDNTAAALYLKQIPTATLLQASHACTAGTFDIGKSVFGSCDNGVFTPAQTMSSLTLPTKTVLAPSIRGFFAATATTMNMFVDAPVGTPGKTNTYTLFYGGVLVSSMTIADGATGVFNVPKVTGTLYPKGAWTIHAAAYGDSWHVMVPSPQVTAP